MLTKGINKVLHIFARGYNQNGMSRKMLKLSILTLLLTGGILLSLLSLTYPFMSHASAEVPTPPPNSWSYCANDGGYCSFTGIKIVEYGWDMGLGQNLWVTKKLASKTYTLNDGSSVEGVLCNANEFNPVSGAPLVNICMIRDLTPALDTVWSAAVGDDNKSVTVTFSYKETQAGTLDDLKKKIRIKRTDEANFKELDSEDSVSNSTTGEVSTLQISFNRPLMGLDNQIRIDAGALADLVGDVLDRAIEINDLPENDLGVWQDVGNRGLSEGNTLDMSLISVNSTPFLAYTDGGAGNRLFVKKYDGNSWVQAGDALSTGQVGLQAFTRGFSMAVSNGTLYVAYCDAANGFKVSVKKYVGNSWLPVGNTDVSSGQGYEMSLAISDGIPYVAYKDNVNLSKITVKKYEESSNGWVTLGSMGFSQNAVSQISLSINEGVPYVAFRNEKPVRVNHNGMYYDEIEYSGVFKKFDEASGNWLDLGGFATGGFSTTSLIINNGIPYVAYVDWLTGYGVTLKKYEGNSWTRADNNANFKVGDSSNISYTSFYFSEGTLYVAYRGIDFKDSVKKYNGSSWVSVGVLNGAAVIGKSLYVDNGVPYLAYSDLLIAGVYDRKPMVQKFLLTPSVLTADTTSNDTESPIEVTFPDLAAWRNAITAVKDGPTVIQPADYTVSAGKITFKPGVLAKGIRTITVSAGLYADTTVNQKMNLRSPSLMQDTTVNYVVNAIEVTFPDNEGWRGAITAVKDGTTKLPLESYDVVAGKITFNAGVLIEGNHTITVSAADYLDTSVNQTVNWIPSPALTADTTDNNAASTIDLTFTDAEGWSDEITTVKDGTKTLSLAKYSISNGKITLKAGALLMGSHSITIIAPNYADAIVSQIVFLKPPALTADTTGNNVSNAIDISFTDDAAWRSAITALNDGTTLLPIEIYTIRSGKITFNAGVLAAGSHTIKVIATGYSDTIISQAILSSAVDLSGSTTDPATGSTAGTAAPSNPAITSTDGSLTLPIGKTGDVSLKNQVTVSIPADASAKELKVTIDEVLDTKNLLMNKEALASPIFEILKNFSENFSKPVTLTLSFDLTSLKEGQKASIFYYDEVKKIWVEVGGIVEGDHIIAEVNHFTKYAVFAVNQVAGMPTIDHSADTKLNFTDLSGHWSEANITQAVSIGIATGYPDGTFKPNQTVTRAEFSVMLFNTLKLQGEDAPLTFTDTAKIGDWAQKAVAQAVRHGIIKGYEDGSFRPDVEITRAEMAVMLANALGQHSETVAASGFADDKDITAWAKTSIAYVKQAGIVQGKGDNQFAPQEHATRAEAITVLLRVKLQMSKQS